MTHSVPKAPPYPRSHLLAASGVAALLSLALLVFPSREVEAKKTYLSLELENGSEQIVQEKDDLRPGQAAGDGGASPFADAGLSDNKNSAQADADKNNQASLPTDPLQKSVTVASGDTLSTVFSRVGLDANALQEAIGSSKEAKRFGRLHVGQVLEFKLTADGKLERLGSKLSDLESISLTRSDNGFSFKRELVKPDVRTTYAHGVINSSLFLSAKRAGLSHSLTMDLANVFGYDIDFAQDIREGDEFEVIYEEHVVGNKQVGSGNILSARFTNRGKTYTAVRYTSKQGVTSYYNADGMSMRKAFIRTPVDFARISSKFSMGRRHPILNKIRAHKGVDYAAPRGTPIKAAGDGRIMLAGRRGGYGNTVIIQHGNSYRTLYGHMQGFAKGIRNGVSVKQGQIIGYIGTTGLSTGPHLHYEFQVNGRHVDPLSQKLPMADPIARNEKQRFLQQSKPLMARMDQEKATLLAANKQP
ncbi:peptidoglycan DD-metalloendopeptidase family protein [Aquipseudomonas alcaligenes]|mgnify:CR=1 FL=1|jgi:murein DD-endopeptidase MepM/ murein hydrolase activator NlpD|uniref:Peptidase M23 n=1 Tax=Aquipseudomonas alcaligenes TaxID=43263 RepID=A0AA37CIR1_AQUAC|nr:peptidoglycan DD-metalloendopeptidase family protein [Pseudomonas alcaligenes]MDH1056926.1 peptidoglycan DD-metalloendopeptidase family protein [Pseudomonas alcaligenes]BCR23129.1 peptidase M23 [Pseudomonas alcaligenes]GIZ68611.1 peptidase M23 [Pseudomonas alcaligenes]GIZ73052.1 peptidase M23 [Pseudomonas alcaligenes]GIZ77345.1 peptidase M23 [Pseudomonas alcaligenes]